MLKTSAQWYREDTKSDINDPDGWDRMYGALYWFKVPILQSEYEKRKSLSTCVSFGKNQHLHPFQWNAYWEKEFETFEKKHCLGKMLIQEWFNHWTDKDYEETDLDLLKIKK